MYAGDYLSCCPRWAEVDPHPLKPWDSTNIRKQVIKGPGNHEKYISSLYNAAAQFFDRPQYKISHVFKTLASCMIGIDRH